MYNGTLILISLLFASSVFAQPTLQWARTYNGPANDRDAAGSIVVDDSGYVYVRGGLTGVGTNAFSYCTIKYKPNGDSVWVRIYDEPGNTFNVGSGLNVDDIGNVYVTGYPATIKYDRFGNIVWLVTSTTFFGIKIDFDASGNIYVGGTSINKFTLKKYTNTGTLLWSRIFDDGGGGTAKDMALDKFGNIILVGEMAYKGTSYDFFTMKFNSLGDILWSRSYNGPGGFPPYDWANAVALDDTGNIYVTGLSQEPNRNSVYLTVKYDSSGNEKWMKMYSGGIAYDIEVDKTGNVFVAGVTGLSSYTLLKYANDGNLLWSETSPAYFLADRVSITLDSAGNVYLAGAKQSNHLVIIKYNVYGIEQWTILYPQGSANDITIDKFNNIYACGVGAGPGITDFLTVKYSQPIGIVPVSSEIPKSFLLSQNYPNPFNPKTKIKLDIPRLSFIKLIVYDILGREVAVLVNQELKAGSYETNWYADSYGSGLYFYKLTSDNIIINTKKMILIK